MEYIPYSALDSSWCGKERTCTRCQERFVSKQNLGQCRSCGLIFRASEAYGLCPDTTVEDELRISDSESARILALPLERIDAIPQQLYEWGGTREEMAEFEFFRNRLISALEAGAELFQYCDAGSHHRMCWLIAIRDNRAVAMIRSEVALWD